MTFSDKVAVAQRVTKCHEMAGHGRRQHYPEDLGMLANQLLLLLLLLRLLSNEASNKVLDVR